jgi:hypothetical protein
MVHLPGAKGPHRFLPMPIRCAVLSVIIDVKANGLLANRIELAA